MDFYNDAVDKGSKTAKKKKEWRMYIKFCILITKNIPYNE